MGSCCEFILLFTVLPFLVNRAKFRLEGHDNNISTKSHLLLTVANMELKYFLL